MNHTRYRAPFSTGRVRSRSVQLSVELLESRDAPAVDPFGSAQFNTLMNQLLDSNGVPLASLALQRDNEVYHWTNNTSSVNSTSLFRVASVSKTFCAVAVMTLQQEGLLKLGDSALKALGYSPGQVVAGLEPVDGVTPVGIALPGELFNITIRQLLQMSSGLPLAVPVASATFPDAEPQQVVYLAGSYAALAFAHPPPFTGPASVNEQIKYYLYQVATQFAANPVVYGGKDALAKQAQGQAVLIKPGSFYLYNDTGYAMLGALVEKIAQEQFNQSYIEYLTDKVLTPMGISPPSANPAVNRMVGLGRTLENQAYPTEVAYETYPDETDKPNIFPDPNKNLQSDAPFYPTDQDDQPIKVPMPYGGDFFLESHFGEGGLVATPAGLVRFFDTLGDILDGTADGPLKRKTIRKMVAQPPAPLQVDVGVGWFGMGWQVQPETDAYNRGVAWVKNGSLPGNSALLYRYHDGTTWAATFNIDVLGDSEAYTDFQRRFQAIVDGAIYGPRTVQIVKGSPQATAKGTAFPEPLVVLVLDVFGGVVRGAQVTFTAPTGGPSGSFKGQATALVQTGTNGKAKAPPLKANGESGTFQVHAQATLLFPPTPFFWYSFESVNDAVFQLQVA